MTPTTAWRLGAATLLIIAVILVLRSEWSAAVGAVVLGTVMGGFGLAEPRQRRP